ncbi:hypothetical protein LMANV2_660031 [Leptospira interrogans serovar Manilae]|uniref:Uncharacterized protein n=1 Tax=Leptospira interrogans serovar Manilae TaxID=214675 RepID=A0AAQ1P1L8_LEPIR|nr:hypothetical protein [Leptospira interrogans]EYU63727.1 hypothetical protein CI00_12180 [Leptospira interrogans serovar Manilae]SOR63269.1 hypothetical protein LMANV2_660031 [Leptospira interrogans serovar Manilae]
MERPDVKVIVVDFPERKFKSRAKVFRDFIGTHVYLVHADVTSLPFQDQIFDCSDVSTYSGL